MDEIRFLGIGFVVIGAVVIAAMAGLRHESDPGYKPARSGDGVIPRDLIPHDLIPGSAPASTPSMTSSLVRDGRLVHF